MSVARINVKSMDYFKFKKLVIDGNRDDYGSCSKEIKILCDCVQTLKFRDEEFDDESDRDRFDEICYYYKQIMASKRIDPADMRIKSGWWGDHKNAYSAGKLKPAVLKESLVAKAKQWTERHGGVLTKVNDTKLQNMLEGPGLFVLKHKDHQCFQYVGRADKIFARVAEKLKMSFEGSLQEPLAALLVISMMSDWEFYFIPVQANDDPKMLGILENDLILKHDSIWPHGLNFRLHIDSLLEVSEFRKSCLRHDWPPDSDSIGDEDEIDLNRLRKAIASQPGDFCPAPPPPTPPAKPKAKRAPPQMPSPPPSPPPFMFDMDPSPEEIERPSSSLSGDTYIVSVSQQDIPQAMEDIDPVPKSPKLPKPKPSPGTPRPTSAGKRGEKTVGKSTERTSVSKSSSRPVSGRDRPTTPRGKPSKRPNSMNGDREGDVTSPEDDHLYMEESNSSNSLSSVDGRMQHDTPTRKSPAPRAPKPRPTSGRSKQEKSKLPVARH